MDIRYPAPPRGPALDDPATRATLRRYQRRTWLPVLAGVAVLILSVVAANIDTSALAPDNVMANWIVGAWLLGPVLVVVGLAYRVKAWRWRRLLSQHEWREVRYHYSEELVTTTHTGSDGVEVDESVHAQLRIPDLAGPDGSRPLLLTLDVTWTKLRWLLLPWRHAGVAWLAGDLSAGISLWSRCLVPDRSLGPTRSARSRVGSDGSAPGQYRSMSGGVPSMMEMRTAATATCCAFLEACQRGKCSVEHDQLWCHPLGPPSVAPCSLLIRPLS